jgi:HEAT repeat protein
LITSTWSPERQRLEEQAEMLVRALRSREDSVQELAIVQLSLLGPKAVPYLASALEKALEEVDSGRGVYSSQSDPERGIEGICRALGVIRDSSAVLDLAEALPRREAVEALAKIGGERALELVIRTIENDSSSGGPLRIYETRVSAAAGEDNSEFVKRVFLLFGSMGRKRLEEESRKGSRSKRAAVAEILRMLETGGRA